jgi:hypothetical protein
VGRIGAAVPPALVAAAIALDAGTHRYAFARRGVPFGVYFSTVHIAVTFTGALGGAVGVLHRSVRARLRSAAQQIAAQE